ncbi:MAG: NAD(P)-dependent oxidoreductase [Isosphaeraceae bacterium]
MSLPILDQGDDDFEGEMPRTVLLTGASGNLGKKLREAWSDVYELILIDQEADPDDPDVIVADLSRPDPEWLDLFDEADAVVHLAANPSEKARWPDLLGPNLDALFHVAHAAALAGCDRLVFASSNHAMGGYRFDGSEGPITPAIDPSPDGPYGATKLMGERLGLSLTTFFNLEFVALRIGWCQPGENQPDTLLNDWDRSIWLSNRDFVQLCTRAIEADLGERRFVVANGVSRNRGSRWDLTEAIEILGYEPEDDAWAGSA